MAGAPRTGVAAWRADEADAALGTYRDTVAVRERSADVASMRPVLMPASVAVIGASRRPGSVGRAILCNIIDGGFPSPVYPVNPGTAELDGIPWLPSAAARAAGHLGGMTAARRLPAPELPVGPAATH